MYAIYRVNAGELDADKQASALTGAPLVAVWATPPDLLTTRGLHQIPTHSSQGWDVLTADPYDSL